MTEKHMLFMILNLHIQFGIITSVYKCLETS